MTDVAEPGKIESRQVARRRVPVEASDREFLPAALEIVETPPSPIRTGFIYALAALTVTALAWSYLGFLDVHAVASGKIQASGRAKVVQPAEAGKVAAIRVKNGDQVRGGDVLIELDRAEALATRTATLENLSSLRAEIARRRAAIDAADSAEESRRLSVDWSPEIAPDISAREERVLAADVAQFGATINSLKAQKAQKEAERNKAVGSIRVLKALVDAMAERVGMYERLLRQKFGSRLEYVNALHDFLQAKNQLVEVEGSLSQATTAMEAIEADIFKTRKTFVSDNTQKLADAEQKSAGLVQDLAKADSRLDHMTLTAPIGGIVQASTITTVGQVVNAGQELMHVVPDGLPLEIEAYVLNRDAAFVAVGQEAVIKIDAFPFTRFGTVIGKVIRVAEDAIAGAQVQQTLRDPSQAPSGALALTSAAQQTQDLVCPVTVVPSQMNMVVEGKAMPLTSGMTVTVEIKTERRRVIDYILSPLIEVGTTAMRER